ncbi:lipoprotein, putative [Burkholderia thailandensis E264]|uniref:Lipoprotein, putative n=1 Tax=Burkholderia thailandensis (strain ATCC 700388 / DSM 13276 / CCUG 48851 / CIP 106301 / E264) TaxID=271848 RepID=Q2STY0_BURTA|nr:lipoprotein, putative [Burkholderia thailandensis E264]
MRRRRLVTTNPAFSRTRGLFLCAHHACGGFGCDT